MKSGKKLESARFTTSKIVTMRNPLPIDTKYELNGEIGDYILYFGRLSPEKGVRTLIDAVKTVGCKLEILGTGPIEDELKTYVKENGISGVTFRGFQSGQTLIDYIKRSRCVVVPSVWYENCPYSVMEAMAMGKPLIVSNYGGLPELVRHGENGFVYKTVNEASSSVLAKYINQMISLSPAKCKHMGEISLENARSMFIPDKYIDRLEDYASISAISHI